MKNKITLVLLLAAASCGVRAEWEVAGDSEILTAYANPDTIRKNGAMAQMWTLADFKTVQDRTEADPFMSSKWHNEYDCEKARWRMLYASIHSEKMGNGSAFVVVEETQKWRLISLLSINNSMRKLACGNR